MKVQSTNLTQTEFALDRGIKYESRADEFNWATNLQIKLMDRMAF